MRRPQKDRNHMQVPRCLPEWMDGPLIREKAKLWDCSYEQAKRTLRKRRKVVKRIDKMLYG